MPFSSKAQKGKMKLKSYANDKSTKCIDECQNRQKSISKSKEEDTDGKSELSVVTLNLGAIAHRMNHEGIWRLASQIKGQNKSKEIRRLQADNEILTGQNYMIRLKNEILNDMISRKRMELVKMGEEVDKLKEAMSHSSSLTRVRE